MKRVVFPLALLLTVAGYSQSHPQMATAGAALAISSSATVRGPFSDQDLRQFTSLGPIDTHTHVFQGNPAFYAMLKKLNLHIVDILVDDGQKTFPREKHGAWEVVHGSDGYAVLCTTFNPFPFSQPNFDKDTIRQLNQDFDQGAVAVKIWKNVGMEIKDANGNYVMPDNPAFEPIYKDIAAHNKTLIAHLADPNTIWQAPNPSAPDYEYYMHDPKLYMYGKHNVPTKEEILRARDRILKENPDLRVVGAHLGSMEANFTELGQHLDQYPNFAVDLAARMDYFEMQPRATIIAFITKYQDRLIYGTDNEFNPGRNAQGAVKELESTYADDWRFLATNDTILCPHCNNGHKKQGLSLPQSILRKLYHDNAVKWFPGILSVGH